MELVLVALSTVLAVVPMLAALAIVWLSDRYDREPIWLVLLTFFWGATGAVIIALPLNTLFGVVAPLAAPLVTAVGLPADVYVATVGAAVGAPLIEEPAKALFFLFLAWNRRPSDMSAGFIYGAAAGLGFAMTENFLYFSSQSAAGLAAFATTVAVRTFYCASLHAMASSVVGAAVGFARLRGWLVLAIVGAAGLALAMVIHATWNGLLALDSFTTSDLTFANFVLLPLEVLAVLFVWQLCLIDDGLTIRRELRDEEERGVLPRDHSWQLASWWRRTLRPIHLPGVDAARYVHTATALARRKRELALLDTRAPAYYRDDVRRLRRQLQMLLDADASRNPVALTTGDTSRGT